MTEEQFHGMFRTVADHLESLAISIQNVEDLQEQDRTRQEADRARQEADHARLNRLERLFKLMIRIGDRERKDLRERINALIDAHIRSEDKLEQLSEAQKRSAEAFALFQAQMTKIQKKADERMLRQEEANAQFQAQVGQTLSKLEETQSQFQAQVGQTLSKLEETQSQFQAQVGQALSKLADATAFGHRRLDALEANLQP